MTAAIPSSLDGSSTKRRILVVCLGCHCRSPFAAAVLSRRGGDVEVRSAGTRDKHVGRPAHPSMVAAAKARGYDISGHRGVQVSRDLLEWADVILAMDRMVLSTLRALANSRTAAKLTLYLHDQDVPDPWGQDEDAFASCAAVIESGVTRHC